MFSAADRPWEPEIPERELLVESSHPPEARIHKWEARKDLGVVSAWIEAGSRPGDLVVDPFMGSGTAPLAAARLGRRAIGFDLNPLALGLARLVAAPPDPASVAEAFRRVEARLRSPREGFTFTDLYRTSCPCCGGEAELAHMVWSVRIACGCGEVVPAHRWTKGQGRGARARCPTCEAPQPRGPSVYVGQEPWLLFARCGGCGLQEATPGPADVELSARFEQLRGGAGVWTPTGVPLRYPDGRIFAQLRHALRARPLLDELWTGRNFLATGLLAEAIDEEQGEVREALRISLSSIVKATSKMPTVNSGGWRNKGTGLSSHLLGIFPMHLEQNAWEEFERHVLRRLLPGLKAARSRPKVRLVEEPAHPGDLSLREGDAALGLASLPAESVTFAFADPPYGDAVQYAELALPHLAWLSRPLTGAALNERMGVWLQRVVQAEVVENRSQGKDRKSFEEALQRVLGELRRVIHKGGSTVLTFNSPDETLIRAVTDAALAVGFRTGGIHHQEAFKDSHKGSWHEGTAKGTLFLRFLR